MKHENFFCFSPALISLRILWCLKRNGSESNFDWIWQYVSTNFFNKRDLLWRTIIMCFCDLALRLLPVFLSFTTRLFCKTTKNSSQLHESTMSKLSHPKWKSSFRCFCWVLYAGHKKLRKESTNKLYLSRQFAHHKKIYSLTFTISNNYCSFSWLSKLCWAKCLDLNFKQTFKSTLFP